MRGPLDPQPHTYRRYANELSRLTDAWGGDDPAARAALTLAALRMIFERLCGRAGSAPQLEWSHPQEAVEVPSGYPAAVRYLLDRWEWRQGAAGSVDGDLIGYLFERSLARKELGAYYTAPDVAAYICRSTLVPRLFELAGAAPELRSLAGSAGVVRYLPRTIQQPERLPLESAYEQRLRSMRLAETIAAWESGQIATIDDCLTWNLDLTRIALDCIEQGSDTGPVDRWREALAAIRVLDPTCGSGDFLLATYDLLACLCQACSCREGGSAFPRFDPLRNLYGLDLLPGAVEVTRMRLYLRAREHGTSGHDLHVMAADFLSGRPEAPAPFRGAAGEGIRFDAVVGNPPYVGCARERSRYRSLGYQTAAAGNLYALVMERSLALLEEQGRLGMIVPISSVSSPEYTPLVRQLTTGSSWVSTYSNRPAKLFTGVEQRLAIWLTARNGPPRLRVSPYQHWWREERPQLFERLRYHESALTPTESMPVKTGCAVSERIFRRIAAHRGRLGEHVRPGEHAVWLHDGPTYWVRALPFRPNELDGPQRSRHYQCLPVPEAEAALIVAAILSCTTYYLFYKWTSNCRDLTRHDWAHFPLDPLPSTLRGELAAWGAQLADRLRGTAARRARVYPSGPVTYEEYYPAHAKEILDEIDRLLARHYGFTAEELEYILNYDLKYRMGRPNAEHDEH